MKKRFELSPFAKRRLIDIVIWTDENFGELKSDRYQELLLDKCRAITDGLAHTQDCAVITKSSENTGLLFSRAGRHFIFFRDTGDVIVVLDFVHVASDLVRLITGNTNY